jgi:hypothetical protein
MSDPDDALHIISPGPYGRKGLDAPRRLPCKGDDDLRRARTDLRLRRSACCSVPAAIRPGLGAPAGFSRGGFAVLRGRQWVPTAMRVNDPPGVRGRWATGELDALHEAADALAVTTGRLGALAATRLSPRRSAKRCVGSLAEGTSAACAGGSPENAPTDS